MKLRNIYIISGLKKKIKILKKYSEINEKKTHKSQTYDVTKAVKKGNLKVNIPMLKIK